MGEGCNDPTDSCAYLWELPIDVILVSSNRYVMEQDIYNRIGKLEDGITDVKVELAQTYKDLINHHKMDEVNSKHYKEELAAIREATKDRYEGKGRFDKWVGEILTPQTIAIVLAIIAAIVGAKL